MNVYFWNQKRNFGDFLTPLLLKKFTRLQATHSSAEKAELVMVGSIVEQIPQNWKGVIAGIGCLHEKTRVAFNNAKILGVRGPLTSGRVVRSNKQSIVLGDPGLLADELVGLQEKKYELGLVSHWSDKELTKNPMFLRYSPKIINVLDDPLKVIAEIGQCKKIVSSSLHGIIVADAFGIPRRIEIPPRALSHPQHEGGLFKWNDYSASLGVKLEIGLTQEIKRTTIIDKQHELYDMLEEVKGIFKHSLFPSQNQFVDPLLN